MIPLDGVQVISDVSGNDPSRSPTLQLEMGIEPNPNGTNRTRTLIYERTKQKPNLFYRLNKNPNRTEPK